MKVAYLGPAGTFSEDAVRAATADLDVDPLPLATVHEAIAAVSEGQADLALVPAATLGEAVVAHPPRSLVVKAGRVVSRDGDGR